MAASYQQEDRVAAAAKDAPLGDEEVQSPRSLEGTLTFGLVLMAIAVGIMALYTTLTLPASSSSIAMKETGTSTLSLNDENRTFTFVDMLDTPLGIYSSSSGQYVITSDVSGYVYVSSDFGSSFTTSRPFMVTRKEYTGIYGLVMTDEGDRIVAGTQTHPTYISYDYGSTWTELSTQKCATLVGTEGLDKLACLSGTTSSSSIAISIDGGSTWSDADISSNHFIGLIANSDFSYIGTALYTGSPYFWYTEDLGSTWLNTTFNEVPTLTWGCIASDSNITNIILTDTSTRNTHMTEDNGVFWWQIYEGDNLSPSISVTACAVSRSDNIYAVGFSGQSIQTVFDCPDAIDCGPNGWESQEGASSSGFFNTTSIALSSDGTYMFSTDVNTMQISVGVLLSN